MRPHRLDSLTFRASRRLRRQVLDPLSDATLKPYRRWRNAKRNFRPIFVAGAMGSGTSLVALELGQRFECAGVVTESALQVSERSFLHVEHVRTYASVAAYDAQIRPQPDWSHEDARRLLLELYRETASRAGSAIVDKGPNTNLVRARFLAECFPNARFVLVFRDPVANVEGFRRKWSTFGADTLAENLRFYGEIHETFLEAAPGLGCDVVSVEYEALVESPDATFARLGERLGLAANRRPRRLRRELNTPGPGIRNVSGGSIEIVQDATTRSRGRLEPAEIQQIQTALGPLHERLRAMAIG